MKVIILLVSILSAVLSRDTQKLRMKAKSGVAVDHHSRYRASKKSGLTKKSEKKSKKHKKKSSKTHKKKDKYDDSLTTDD